MPEFVCDACGGPNASLPEHPQEPFWGRIAATRTCPQTAASQQSPPATLPRDTGMPLRMRLIQSQSQSDQISDSCAAPSVEKWRYIRKGQSNQHPDRNDPEQKSEGGFRLRLTA